MPAHPPFQSSSLSLSGWGGRCFCPADIYASCLFDTAPPFSFREPPTQCQCGSGVEMDPVWPIREPTHPGPCDWLRRGTRDPSQSNQSQCLDQVVFSLMMAVRMEPGDAGSYLATERGAPIKQRPDSDNTHVLDHTTPGAKIYPWTRANTFLSQFELCFLSLATEKES